MFQLIHAQDKILNKKKRGKCIITHFLFLLNMKLVFYIWKRNYIIALVFTIRIVIMVTTWYLGEKKNKHTKIKLMSHAHWFMVIRNSCMNQWMYESINLTKIFWWVYIWKNENNYVTSN